MPGQAEPAAVHRPPQAKPGSSPDPLSSGLQPSFCSGAHQCATVFPVVLLSGAEESVLSPLVKFCAAVDKENDFPEQAEWGGAVRQRLFLLSSHVYFSVLTRYNCSLADRSSQHDTTGRQAQRCWKFRLFLRLLTRLRGAVFRTVFQRKAENGK